MHNLEDPSKNREERKWSLVTQLISALIFNHHLNLCYLHLPWKPTVDEGHIKNIDQASNTKREHRLYRCKIKIVGDTALCHFLDFKY